MAEFDNKFQAQLENAQLNLKNLLGEKIPLISELTSSGRLLAEHCAFVIQAIESGINPEEYWRVGSAHTTRIKIQYGEHEADQLSKTYVYNYEGKLTEVKDSVTLWRQNGLRDYIKPTVNSSK